MGKNLRLTEQQLKDFVGRGRAAQGAVDNHLVLHRAHGKTTLDRQLRAASGDRGRWSLELRAQIIADGFEAPTMEYKFALPRKFSADLAWVDTKMAIEVDSMVHRTVGRFKSDMEKYNFYTFLGWRLIRVTPKQVRDGGALALVRRFLRG